MVSSRYLAEQFPSAGKVVGIDLSPHMVLTGRHFQQEDEVNSRVPPLIFAFG